MSGMKSLLGDTPFPPPTFQGTTFIHSRDYDRLSGQAKRVADEMKDGCWHTLRDLARVTGDPEASISARIRDLRSAGCSVEREYVRGGLHRYRLRAS